MDESQSVGSTTLVRIPLSHKWIINDAKVFLSNCGDLESPGFFLKIPYQTSSFKNLVSSSWHLLIEDKNSHSLTLTAFTSSSLTLSLCQGDLGNGGSGPPRKVRKKFDESIDANTVLISDCVFTILHPETNEQLFSSTPAKQQKFVVNNSPKTCCTVKCIESKDVDKYLFNGTLTLQVKATLLCIGSPQETAGLIHKVQLDNIREELHSSYKDELFTNVVIRCREEEFKVHKVILASQSPVFKKMFEINMREKVSGVVTISDIPPAAVSDLVAYFYTGTAPNVSTLAKDLLDAAKKYELPRLFTICENELKTKIQVHNAIDTLLLADLYDAASLKQACLNFIHLNLAVLRRTDRWKDLKQHGELLMEILN